MHISTSDPKAKTVGDFEAGAILGVDKYDGAKNYYIMTDWRDKDRPDARQVVNLRTGAIGLLDRDKQATGYPNAVTYPYGHPRQRSDETKPKAVLENGAGIYALVNGSGKSRYFAVLSPCDSSVMHKIQNACANLKDGDIDAQAKRLVADVKREYGIDLAFLPVKSTFTIS